MKLVELLKSHVSTLVLGSLLVGVGAYEWKQGKAGQVIPTAQAKPAKAALQNVLAEGRVAVPPGAEITVGASSMASFWRWRSRSKTGSKPVSCSAKSTSKSSALRSTKPGRA